VRGYREVLDVVALEVVRQRGGVDDEHLVVHGDDGRRREDVRHEQRDVELALSVQDAADTAVGGLHARQR